MKLSKEYLLRQVFDKYVLIPTGRLIDRGKSTVELNETGFFIARQLLDEISMEELKKRVFKEYEVEKEEEGAVGNEIEKIVEEFNLTNLLE